MSWMRRLAATLGFAMTALVVFGGWTVPVHAQLGSPVGTTCPEAKDAHYFPVGSFTPEPYEDADATRRQWYSNHLTAMAEPSLSCGEFEGDEVYRFLVLGHFWSISVRISRRGDVYNLKAVTMNADDASRGQAGLAANHIAKVLTAEQRRALLDRLDSIRFWSLETVLSVVGYMGVRDGSVRILEARRDGRYHVVRRGTGDSTLASIGPLFFELANIKTEPDEFNPAPSTVPYGTVLPF